MFLLSKTLYPSLSFCHLLSSIILSCILPLCLEFVIYPIAIGERMTYIRARVTWQMKTATLSPRMFGDCKLPEQAIRALEIWKSPTSYLWPLVWVDFTMPIFKKYTENTCDY